MKKKRHALGVGKRKKAIARASVSPGKGRIRINGRLLETYPWFYREIVQRALTIPPSSKLKRVDVRVSVHGGGVMAQAQAVATAIAQGLVKYHEDERLENSYWKADPYLMKWDPRRVETKKYKGRKARARFQKSYR